MIYAPVVHHFELRVFAVIYAPVVHFDLVFLQQFEEATTLTAKLRRFAGLYWAPAPLLPLVYPARMRCQDNWHLPNPVRFR